jgi:hypothetical protein
MHFLYVDESGDAGSKAGSSCHFILGGLLLHHTDWREAKTSTLAMRIRLQEQFGMDSCDTQFLQLADLLAYLTKQELNPGKAFSDGHSRRILKRLRRLFADQKA